MERLTKHMFIAHEFQISVSPKIKVLATKPDDMNSNPRTHMERINSCKEFSDFHTYIQWYMFAHKIINKCKHIFNLSDFCIK